MKKLIVVLIITLFSVAVLVGCTEIKTGNRMLAGKDVQTFNYAYVRIGDKNVVEGYVTQWRDYDNSDEVQVLLDGKFYLTHYSNVVLVADPSLGALQYSDPSVWGGEQ